MAQFSGTIELGVTTGNDADLIQNTNIWNGGVIDGSGYFPISSMARNAVLGGYASTGKTCLLYTSPSPRD